MPGSTANTRQPRRRPLRFHTLSDLLIEAERLAAAEREGRLEQTGNWALGQAIAHLAGWMATAIDGPPPQLPPPPAALKLLARLFKKRFLNKPAPSGIRLPKVEGGTLFTDPVPTGAALARLREAVGRIERDPIQPNAVLGVLTRDEVIRLNLRHAELHLGFFWPAGPNPAAGDGADRPLARPPGG